jgi:cytochrome c556
MLRQSILRLRSIIELLIFSSMIFSPFVAQADVIAERKANFKANAAAMKAINAALSDGDFDALITQAKIIADWAHVMPDYFPANSVMGDTKARADIWANFDDFKNRASANEKAALKLISTAETDDVSDTIRAFKKLGSTCKSCHKSFKD